MYQGNLMYDRKKIFFAQIPGKKLFFMSHMALLYNFFPRHAMSVLYDSLELNFLLQKTHFVSIALKFMLKEVFNANLKKGEMIAAISPYVKRDAFSDTRTGKGVTVRKSKCTDVGISHKNSIKKLSV